MTLICNVDKKVCTKRKEYTIMQVNDGFSLNDLFSKVGKAIFGDIEKTGDTQKTEQKPQMNSVFEKVSDNEYQRISDEGLVLERYSVDSTTGAVKEVDKYEYDDNGRIIKMECDYLDAKGKKGTDGKAEYVESYEYDENGNLVKETRKQPTGRISVTTYEYNDKNSKILRTEDYEGGPKGADGEADKITHYSKDADGKTIVAYDYGADGTIDYFRKL